jgi:glycine dehydrogenase
MLKSISKKINIFRISNIFCRKIHYIGQDYYSNKFNPLVHTEIFKNPKWYSAYTSYQSEISQGRLELTYLYQEFIKSVSGLDVSNSGLLDHSHSLFEAIRLSINNSYKNDKKKYVLVDKNLFNNLNNVLDTYSNLIFSKDNIEIIYTNFCKSDNDINNFINSRNIDRNNIIGIVIFSSDKYGFINKNYDWARRLQKEINEINKNLYDKEKNYCLITISGDLMHHLQLKSHKDLGANIGIGNIQRMGIPLFCGGPHGGYFAIDNSLLKLLPGKLVDTSIDKYDDTYFRLALQTREQHIKKNRATSNICTNQALINNYMIAWCLYYGKNGLIEQSNKIKDYKEILVNELDIDKNLFIDSITIKKINDELVNKVVKDLYVHKNKLFTGTFTNMNTLSDIDNLINILKKEKILINKYLNKNIFRENENFLNDKIFNKYENNPLEFMRYIKSLEKKDFSLADGMIPLGSCTMKYNPHESLEVLNNTNLLNMHPYEISNLKTDFMIKLEELKNNLKYLTGFENMSLQPLSGSHSELTALLIMKKFFNFERNIVLIPNSAHGTNPASVSVAGCETIFIRRY